MSLFLAAEEINGLGARHPLSLRVISELNREPDVGPVAERGHVRRPRRGARRGRRCTGLRGPRAGPHPRSPPPPRPLLRRVPNVARGKAKASGCAAKAQPLAAGPGGEPPPPSPALAALRRRWAQLIRRVYQIDPLVCPRCRGVMRLVSFITQPRLIRRILEHLAGRAGSGPHLRHPALSLSSPDPYRAAAIATVAGQGRDASQSRSAGTDHSPQGPGRTSRQAPPGRAVSLRLPLAPRRSATPRPLHAPSVLPPGLTPEMEVPIPGRD